MIAEYDLDARQVDVKGAFLQAKLSETVYMRQPDGYIDPNFPEKVFLLLKSLYGLRQAGNEWWKLLRSELAKLGFSPLNADITIYIKIIDSQTILICFHINDSLIAVTKGWMYIVIEILEKTPFTITDLGEPASLLGCLIERNREAGTIKISQPGYIDQLVDRFSLSESKVFPCPMAGDLLPSFNDSKDEAVDKILYLEYIGSLNWCAVATRPDISFAVSHLASFSTRPSHRHLNAAKRVILYLKGTRSHGIVYKRGDPIVRGYADADYANEISGMASQSLGGVSRLPVALSLGPLRSNIAYPVPRWNRSIMQLLWLARRPSGFTLYSRRSQ
jgi:hypothetical protein